MVAVLGGTGCRIKSLGRFARSVAMITHRPVIGSLRNSGKLGNSSRVVGRAQKGAWQTFDYILRLPDPRCIWPNGSLMAANIEGNICRVQVRHFSFSSEVRFTRLSRPGKRAIRPKGGTLPKRVFGWVDTGPLLETPYHGPCAPAAETS